MKSDKLDFRLGSFMLTFSTLLNIYDAGELRCLTDDADSKEVDEVI